MPLLTSRTPTLRLGLQWARPSAPLLRAALLAVVALAAVACTEVTDDEQDPLRGKGDVPELEGAPACEARQKDVSQAGRTLFIDGAVRWPVSDVEGVNTVIQDDRGQEYAEYFAIVRDIPADPVATEEEMGVGEVYGHVLKEREVELDADQLDWLLFNPDARVGACVFTSWHQDIDAPLPACAAGQCPELDGVTVDHTFFKMTHRLNGNAAAHHLLKECFSVPTAGDPADAADPLHDPFFRGCMKCDSTACVPWRRSDPAICAVATRLAECGCSIPSSPADQAAAIIPPLEVQQELAGGVTLRGFPLGTWTHVEQLPSGCQYVETGAEADGRRANVIVACDIFADALADWAHDPKEYCRQQFGDDIVLYATFDTGLISCEPPAEGQYTDSCGEKPWILYPEALEDIVATRGGS